MVPPLSEATSEISKRPSLKASIHDGVWYSVMVGFAEQYFSAFANFLSATTVQVGVLATAPALFGSICQIFGIRLMEFFTSRRREMVIGASLQGLILFPVGLLPFLLPSNELAPWILIFLCFLYFGALGISAPIWSGLIGDLVPISIRGRFFGIRNQWCGLATVIAIIVAGTLLHYTDHHNLSQWGFLIIFWTAGFARLYSALWLSRHEDPPWKSDLVDRFTLFQFLRRAPHSTFFRFVLFTSLMNLSINVAGPYFSLYILRDLHATYIQFMSLSACMLCSQLLFMRLWGRISDQFGTRRVLSFCTCGLVISPSLWLITSNIWLLLVFQIYSGFFWAGYLLASSTYIFDAVTPAKRARCSAYLAIVNGFCVLLGAIVGGFIAQDIDQAIFPRLTLMTPESPYLRVFMLSSLMRFCVALVFLPKVKEFRPVEKIKNRELLFRIVQIRPFSGISLGVESGRRRN